jgi:hypothetical protein
MTVLLGLPIAKVGIGPACAGTRFNAKVDLDNCPRPVQALEVALMAVASEPAERLCPNYDQFRSIHKRHPHLEPFRRGAKNDLVSGFEAVKATYILLGLAEGTAKRRFKAEFRDPAADVIDLNAGAVCRLAERLIQSNALDGAAATAEILADGPLQQADHLNHLDIGPARPPAEEGAIWG